jgi:hypothetical protein
MTMEKVLVNAAEISSISGFPLVFPQSHYGKVGVIISKTQYDCLCPHPFQPTIRNNPQICLK